MIPPRIVRRKQCLTALAGFRGSEDLGGGLKATFELEKRFDLFDGKQRGGKDFDGAANMGLAGNWGRVRFGRINELTTETIRKFDPFYQYGVGNMLESTQRSARIDNTARYDSPKWSGFSFGASYSLGQNTRNEGGYTPINTNGTDNDGYALNLSYDNGPFMATANYSRVADSNDSDTWNVGLAYKFGPARVSLVYEHTNDEGQTGGGSSKPVGRNVQINSVSLSSQKLDTDLWLLGLEWDIGPGQLDASVQYMDWDPNARELKDADIWKYAIGYTYNLSKRTAAYATVSYTDYDEKSAGNFYTGMTRDEIWGFQVGMTHKF